jgi:UDP-N-acetylglucosamine diphosphorylase / glucose-1-phosphate thymidylyltransferase / UDP-N-acetylgalactosamine diphosphorylase / glucosamine-1-phosphate N-acetyltransferase / galactosamine-1-phosphate N-acetyltransferase
MSICLFEDFSIATLLPLTHLQADFDLRSGIYSSKERVQRHFHDEELCLLVRLGLVDVMRERTGLRVNETRNAWLYLNGRTIVDDALVGLLNRSRGSDALILNDHSVVAAVVETQEFRELIESWLKTGMLRQELAAGTVPEPVASVSVIREYPARMYRYPWDLVHMNSELLAEDARWIQPGIDEGAAVHPSVIMINPDNISIGPGARIRAGCVLDASNGPVIIGQQADILPHCVLMGPVYVGAASKIKAAAKLYEGTSIGAHCRIGGEVEGSIFHSFANKQHDGFVGHSYFASWTNLGADTNTSDLKNNYSDIRVVLEGKEYHTGLRFLGTIMAEHSKCGINTMLNTGTVVGVGCNIYGGDFPPKALPSFTWGGAGGLVEHEFARCAATAGIVMQRRNQTLTDAEQCLLRDVFVLTAGQREHLVTHRNEPQLP